MVDEATTVPPPRAFGSANPLAGALTFLGETWSLTFAALRFLLRGRVSYRGALAQMSAIGVGSLPIVLAINFATGAVFAYYTASIFVRFGATSFVGGTLSYGFLNELGPLLAGVAVAARSGAAIAAEIGSMVVTEQVDALRAMAVSPIRYLVAPRLVACVLMMPIIGLFADLAGVYGSYLMSATQGVAHESFLQSTRQFASESDLIRGLVKTIWYGLVIAVVACHQGLRTKGGATGVGRATTNSVVLCVVLIFVSDFFLTQLLTTGSTGPR